MVEDAENATVVEKLFVSQIMTLKNFEKHQNNGF